MCRIDKELAKKLANTNKAKYNHNKCAEELLELATLLVQRVNKPNKVSSKKITEEIAHVKIRMSILDEIYNRKDIQKEIDKKTKSLNGYLTKGLHKKRV